MRKAAHRDTSHIDAGCTVLMPRASIVSNKRSASRKPQQSASTGVMITKSSARSVPDSVAVPYKLRHPLRWRWRIDDKRSFSKRYVNRTCKEVRAISILCAARRNRLNMVVAIARRRLVETGNECVESDDLRGVVEAHYIALRYGLTRRRMRPQSE